MKQKTTKQLKEELISIQNKIKEQEEKDYIKIGKLYKEWAEKQYKKTWETSDIISYLKRQIDNLAKTSSQSNFTNNQ